MSASSDALSVSLALLSLLVKRHWNRLKSNLIELVLRRGVRTVRNGTSHASLIQVCDLSGS